MKLYIDFVYTAYMLQVVTERPINWRCSILLLMNGRKMAIDISVPRESQEQVRRLQVLEAFISYS